MSLPHLLLGLLNASPMSGYDLNKVFSTTIQHFWTTDQSQIYRALYKLEEDGKVRVETIIQEDNPNKKVYHITKTGVNELREWLITPLATTAVREAWLGQLFFSYQVDSADVIAVLERYQAELEERLSALEALDAVFAPIEERIHQGREFQFQLLTLDYGLQLHRFECGWLKKAIEQIKQYPAKPVKRNLK